MKTTMILLLGVSFRLIQAKDQSSVELPSIFEREDFSQCEENGVVASWCSKAVHPFLECILLPEFDTYGCSCHGHASLCPSECVGGQMADQKTHYGIQCTGIPQDEPNYVLKETHDRFHCENNAVVSSWCDDFVDKHLECSLHPDQDQYQCRCDGYPASCPEECVDGGKPIMTKFAVRCDGIPDDQPNYILKSN